MFLSKHLRNSTCHQSWSAVFTLCHTPDCKDCIKITRDIRTVKTTSLHPSDINRNNWNNQKPKERETRFVGPVVIRGWGCSCWRLARHPWLHRGRKSSKGCKLQVWTTGTRSWKDGIVGFEALTSDHKLRPWLSFLKKIVFISCVKTCQHCIVESLGIPCDARPDLPDERRRIEECVEICGCEWKGLGVFSEWPWESNFIVARISSPNFDGFRRLEEPLPWGTSSSLRFWIDLQSSCILIESSEIAVRYLGVRKATKMLEMLLRRRWRKTLRAAFIRGGDFDERKARGETPKGLQYSRAFGGKERQETQSEAKNQ